MMARVDRSKHEPQQLAPGRSGWLDVLLSDLTERPRQAVELTIIGDWTPTQAAEHLSVKPVHARC